MLNIVQFGKGNTLKFLGKCQWHELDNQPYEGVEDVRFTLYHKNRDGVEAHTLLLDFDGIGRYEANDLVNAVGEVFGDYFRITLFTGDGFHVYIPLEKFFRAEDLPHYRDSYNEKACIVGHMLSSKVVTDLLVFQAQKFGRVPGSVNSKNKEYVELQYTMEDSPLCPGLPAILDYKEVERAKIIPNQREHDNLNRNPGKFCNFIGYCRNKSETLSYELWSKSMMILGAAGQKDVAREISEGHPDYTEEKFESEYTALKKYAGLTCATVDKLCRATTPVSPCLSCPHNGTGSNPSYVSGELPTASAPAGFHPVKKSVVDGEAVYVVNEHKYVYDDIVNQMINSMRPIIRDGLVYTWSGVYWDCVGGLRMSIDQRSDAFGIYFRDVPSPSMTQMTAVNELLKDLPAASTFMPKYSGVNIEEHRYINFSNGVYDIENDVLHKHDRSLYRFDVPVTLFDETAKCPVWKDFLSYCLPKKDEQALLQVFFGLALSTIPPEIYQQALWINGNPGTGKSTILSVLKSVVGAANTVSLGPITAPATHNGVAFDFSNKKLLCLDDYTSQGKAKDMQWAALLRPFISGTALPYKKLYHDVIEMSPLCLTVITSNDDPPIFSSNDGLNRRIRTLNVYRVPEKPDMTLRDRLHNELPGIVNWAINGLRAYNKNGIPNKSTAEILDRELLHGDVGDVYQEFFNLYYEATYCEDDYDNIPDMHEFFIRAMNVNREMYTIRSFGRRIRKVVEATLHKSRPWLFRRQGGGKYRVVGIKRKGPI